jgi:hypothetical protein
VKLPDRLNAKPYIEQVTVVKQRPENPKEEISGLIAKT